MLWTELASALEGLILLGDMRGYENVNSIVPIAPKNTWHLYLSNKSNFQKIFQRTIFIKTQTTTLLQSFCEFLLDSKHIFKRIIDTDDTSRSAGVNKLTLILLRLLSSKAQGHKDY